MDCGLAEDSWGAGNWLLARPYSPTTKIPEMDRESALKLVLGNRITQDEMEGLGRYGIERANKWCEEHDWSEIKERRKFIPRSKIGDGMLHLKVTDKKS